MFIFDFETRSHFLLYFLMENDVPNTNRLYQVVSSATVSVTGSHRRGGASTGFLREVPGGVALWDD